MRNYECGGVLHHAVLMIRCEHLGDLHHGTIQQMTILSCCLLPSGETKAATIQTINVDGVTRKLILHHHAQVETKTNTAILPIENQNVPTPKLIYLTVVLVQESQQECCAPYYFVLSIVCCDCCVECGNVSLAANRHN